MNKTDVIKMVANREQLALALVTQIVNSFLSAIERSIDFGEDVHLKEFGQFYPYEMKPRTQPIPVQRGLRTTHMIDIPPRKTMGFKPARVLKRRLNRNGVPESGTPMPES